MGNEQSRESTCRFHVLGKAMFGDDGTFTWVITRMTKEQKSVICCGFSRNNSKRRIPDEVMGLLCQHVIEGPNQCSLGTIKALVSEKSNCYIDSPLFVFRGTTFHLRVFRSQMRLIAVSKSNDVVHINCAHMAVTILESGHIFSPNTARYTGYTNTIKSDGQGIDLQYQPPRQPPSYNQHPSALKLDFDKFQQLTVVLSMKQCHVKYKRDLGRGIDFTMRMYSLPIARYRWKVKDLLQLNNSSDVLIKIISLSSFKFCLSVSPNKNSEISVFYRTIFHPTITVKFDFIELEFEELNISQIVPTNCCESDIEFISEEIVEVKSNIVTVTNVNTNLALGKELKTGLCINDLKQIKQLTINLSLRISGINTLHWYKYLAESNIGCDFKEIEDNSHYVWNISPLEMEKMKDIQTVFAFNSHIFEMHSLKWYMILFPSGIQNTNEFYLKLVVCDRSTTVIVKCTISVREIDWKFESVKHFKSEDDTLKVVSFPNISKLEIEKLTIKVDIQLIDVYYGNEIITDNFLMRNGSIALPLPKHEFLWKVRRSALTNLMQNYSISSPYFQAFASKWNILFYPNISGVTKVLIKFNTFDDSLKFYTRCTVSIPEAQIRYTFSAMFCQRSDVGSFYNKKVVLPTKTLAKLDTCTIAIQIELIDVYKDKCNVTERFV